MNIIYLKIAQLYSSHPISQLLQSKLPHLNVIFFSIEVYITEYCWKDIIKVISIGFKCYNTAGSLSLPIPIY